MSGRRDELWAYLRALYSLGMLCAQRKDGLQLTAGGQRYALGHTLVTLAGAGFSFTYAHLWPQELYIRVYTDTGNYYESLVLRGFCLGLCLLHTCLYVRRRRHVALVRQLLRLHLRLRLRCLRTDRRLELYFRRHFMVYVGMAVLCLVNYVNGYARAGLNRVATLIFIGVYLYSFLVMCLLVIFFVCLQQIVAATLATLNRQLAECQSVPHRKHLLYRRYRLLELVAVELMACFGLLVLPVVPLVLALAPSGPLFLVSTVMEGKLERLSDAVIYCFTACLWVVPWLTMLSFLLHSDVIAVEANKTAKILAKIPRTGTGLDKMVEKFLLKNLRQQPILTAYGFFALDKSTLFKLFTAIFTYMVILVQFKEMENSTKSLQKPN